MEIEPIDTKVSYLQARDPSILACNKHGLLRRDQVKLNLETKFTDDTTSLPENESDDNHIKAFLRVKGGVPVPNLYEICSNILVCQLPQSSHAARNLKQGEKITKKYSFSKIFGPDTSQIELFNEVIKPKMLSFINGRNSTILTYGVSGSGKTFTIVGTAEQPGLIPQALEYLFRTLPQLGSSHIKPLANDTVQFLSETQQQNEVAECLSKISSLPHVEKSTHYKTYRKMQDRLSSESAATLGNLSGVSLAVWISFAEIYNESIYDLLEPPPRRGKVRQKLKLGSTKNCTYIKGLKYVNVTSGIDAYQILQYGLHNLNYAATKLNSHSSRSHFIFTMKLIQCLNNQSDKVVVSSFNFCDLAGSERVKKTMNAGDRLKESNNINTSLLVLGRCINHVRNSQYTREHSVIPFRESKLTQLFQNALMGHDDIAMIVNISPSAEMFDETHHVLNFSAVAQDIICEQQPEVILPRASRFSQYIQNESTVEPEFVEDKDRELKWLRDHVANLHLQIETCKEEAEFERVRLIEGYTEILQYRDERCRGLEKEAQELKDKIRRLIDKQNMLVLSDDDDDDLTEQNVIVLSDDEDEALKRQESMSATIIKQEDEKINALQNSLQEKHSEIERLKKILSDAKDDIDYVRNAYEDKLKKLKCEKYSLSQRVCEQEELIHTLSEKRRIYDENSEDSEDC